MQLNRKKRPKILTHRVTVLGLLFLIIFVGEFFFKTWCGVQCIRVGYDISDAQNKQNRLMNIQQNLRIELVHLKSPQVLMGIAKEKLNLTIPNPEQVIVLP